MHKIIKYITFTFLIFSISSCGYNKLVDHEENIQKSWSTVATAYGERGDAAAAFLSELKKADTPTTPKQLNELEKAIKAIEAIDISDESISASDIDDFMKKQDELSDILRKVMSVRGAGAFKSEQLELSQNKIRVARKKFNETVAEYNTYKRQFPQNVTAGPMGFDNYEPLKVDKGGRKL